MRAIRLPAAALACAGLLVSLGGCEAAQAALHRAREAASSAGSAAASRAVHAASAITWTSGPEKSSTFEWKGPVASGKTLEIRGVNGGIRATLAAGPDATVHATLTGREDDPTQVQVQVVKHDGNVTLCAVYPGDDNRCEPGGGHMSVHHNDVRVQFEVGVPAGVQFVPATVNGRVEAEGLTGPVRASTVNGQITVRTTGWAEAHTVNGSIDVRMASTRAPDGLTLKTVNGSISVGLPADAALDVDGSTVNGSISTDFPLTISGHFMNHRVSGSIAGGGTHLSVRTVNGSIDLERGS